MIPKIAHFYWGNATMPLARYITIKSFRKFNPDWNINVYRPAVFRDEITWDSSNQKYKVAGDYWVDVLREFNIINVESLGYNIPHGISHVHQSDFLRWHLLSDIGGLWSDMDIVYFRPITASNIDLNIDLGICYHEYGNTGIYYHCIGFMLSSPNNKFYSQLRDGASAAFDKKEYQSIGSPMVANIFPGTERGGADATDKICALFSPGMVYNIPLPVVYPWDCFTFQGIHNSPPDLSRITRETIGVHWFGGADNIDVFQNSVEENKPQDTAAWWAIKRYYE